MNRFPWSATVGLLTVSALGIATLLFELGAVAAGASITPAALEAGVLDFSVPSSDATSFAVSWICLGTIGLICCLRPWNLNIANYDGRVGLAIIGWIISGGVFLAIGLHAPREMRVLGLWHATVLALLVVILFEGMIRVALSKRRPLVRAHVVSPRYDF